MCGRCPPQTAAAPPGGHRAIRRDTLNGGYALLNSQFGRYGTDIISDKITSVVAALMENKFVTIVSVDKHMYRAHVTRAHVPL
ncbi:hypothetical protein EVAR_57262_1 [Eumeta japonica]|uniref:Uncharacterized protein n=1 Tax=Eumeta variegata TaxID=151549 RepID=A0A4C1ZS96_EUMVA|nr:hypothetical protein EVAR_57262_1 [Eumeta japonica]